MTEKDLTGKTLEHSIANAYREMGANVKHDIEIAGNQIDVYVELRSRDRALHRIAIEAKHYAKPVGVKIVNEFVTVANLLRDQRLIDEGVIISTSGFTRPARKAAETHGIRLLELGDLLTLAKTRAADTKTAYLRNLIIKHWVEDDLPELCQYFGIEYDALPGARKADKVQRFVTELDRLGRQQDLESKLRSLRPHHFGTVRIPVIIVAMKHDETEHKEIAENTLLSPEIRKINEAFYRRYNEQERSGWLPFGMEKGSIQDVLEGFSKRYALFEDGEEYRVEFELHSEAFFLKDAEVEKWVLGNLAERRCLFIVDGVSLFHPDLLSRLQEAISGHEPSALLVLTPEDFRQQKISRLLEERVKSLYRRFFYDYEDRLSPRRGFLIGNPIELQRALYACLKELSFAKSIPEPWRDHYTDSGITATGIETFSMGA